jgi:hypothetical protein
MRNITKAYKDMLIRLNGEGKRGQGADPGGQTGKIGWVDWAADELRATDASTRVLSQIGRSTDARRNGIP